MKYTVCFTLLLTLIVGLITHPFSEITGQTIRPSTHSLQSGADKLPSNVISDILVTGIDVWLGTGRSLSLTQDEGLTFTNFGLKPGMSKGGIAAIANDNGVIWVSSGFDTLISGSSLQAGGGLSWSDDYGETWHFIPQPVDPNNEDSLGYKPTTTHVQNITFDIAIHEGAIWIASMGGGLRKSTDYGQTWTVVTPDGFPFEPLTYLNHRAFAVISADNGLWVGTAQGINKSTDAGETWTNYNAQNSGISGNFITALGKQDVSEGTIIWAATWKAVDENEFYGVSRSTDNGLTWESMLTEERAHNFAFNSDEVYVVTDNGLFKSPDRGKHWGVFPGITGVNGEQIYTTIFYSVAFGSGLLWAGTNDGLVKSADGGVSWTVIRSVNTPGVGGTPKVYAYPNPFSPLRNNLIGGRGHVRIQYSINNPATISLDIYDYGMNTVKNIVSNKSLPAADSYSEAWDGTNNWGRMVANGVYFYKLKISGEGVFWGKIIVIN